MNKLKIKSVLIVLLITLAMSGINAIGLEKIAGIDIEKLIITEDLSFSAYIDCEKIFTTDLYDLTSEMVEYTINALDQEKAEYTRKTLSFITFYLNQLGLNFKKDIKKLFFHFSTTKEFSDITGFGIFEGNFNEDKITDWLKMFGPEIELKTSKINQFKIYNLGDKDLNISFTFDQDKNILIGFNKKALELLLKLKSGDASASSHDRRFEYVWSRFNRHSVSWIFGHISKPLLDMAKQNVEMRKYPQLLNFDYFYMIDDYDGNNQVSEFRLFTLDPKHRKALFNIINGYMLIVTGLKADDPYISMMLDKATFKEDPETNSIHYYFKYPVRENLQMLKDYTKNMILEIIHNMESRFEDFNMLNADEEIEEDDLGEMED